MPIFTQKWAFSREILIVWGEIIFYPPPAYLKRDRENLRVGKFQNPPCVPPFTKGEEWRERTFTKGEEWRERELLQRGKNGERELLQRGKIKRGPFIKEEECGEFTGSRNLQVARLIKSLLKPRRAQLKRLSDNPRKVIAGPGRAKQSPGHDPTCY